MSTHQIEQRTDARSALQRAAEGIRGARGTQPSTNDQAAGFSSVLAALDGIGGLPAVVAGVLGSDGDTALSSLKGAGKDLLKDAVQDLGAGTELAQGLQQQPAPDALAAAQDGAMLLAANGQAPWLSLVGQTAHLDGKGDRELLQGVAGDWLSGRGNAAMAALRQEQGAGAHAAFMAPQPVAGAADATGTALAASAASGTGVAAGADGSAVVSDAAARQAGLAQAADVLAAVQSDAAQTAASTRSASPGQAGRGHMPPDPQAQTAGVRQEAALASGIALHGMTAVRPEEWRGLFDRAREGGSGSAESAANGLHGVAAAVGAAQAGQSAGQQAGGQSSAAFAQPEAQPGSSAEREQQVSEQVAFWVNSKSQNASLSVEHEGKAIQVQVSLQGNEAHVRFGASEAQARDWLGSGADQLRELLQAQGLQLAGVSVDAGGQPGSGDPTRQGAGGQPRQGRVSAMVDAAGATGSSRTAQTGQGRAAAGGVDLFV